MAQRRTSGPGGSRRPGRAGRGRDRGAPSTGSTTATGSTATAATGGPGDRPRARRRRPRLTGRAAVLVLVVVMLTMSYASSLRAYLQQRDHISDLKHEIAARERAIGELEREKRRWDDPAYLRQQARERFGYVMPGERSFVVVDENGEPVSGGGRLEDPDDVVKVEPPAWWESAWTSVELAGNPPRPKPATPPDLIGPGQ